MNRQRPELLRPYWNNASCQTRLYLRFVELVILKSPEMDVLLEFAGLFMAKFHGELGPKVSQEQAKVVQIAGANAASANANAGGQVEDDANVFGDIDFAELDREDPDESADQVMSQMQIVCLQFVQKIKDVCTICFPCGFGDNLENAIAQAYARVPHELWAALKTQPSFSQLLTSAEITSISPRTLGRSCRRLWKLRSRWPP